MVIVAGLVALAAVTAMTFAGTIVIDPVSLAESTAVVFTLVFIAYFGGIYFLGNLNENEKKGMGALL
ncbi:hypothetical protein, partial [Marinovum sp. 1_MG-2023]